MGGYTVKDIKEQEKYLMELKTSDLNALKQLSKEINISIDLLLQEALKDILRKYNRN